MSPPTSSKILFWGQPTFRRTSSLPSWLAVGVALFLGCVTPGYRVRLQATGVMPRERQILTSLENKAKAISGFVVIWEGRESKSFPGSVSSSYIKRLSERPHDQILIHIFYFAERNQLSLDVDNGLRGMEPPVKAEIDGLADMFFEELAGSVGRERVSVERGPSSIPGPFQ